MAQAEVENIYVYDDVNITTQTYKTSSFAGCNNAVDESTSPQFMIYGGIHAINYNLQQDGLGDSSVGLSGFRGGTLDAYLRVSDGGSFGNSGYLALRGEYNRGDSVFSGYIPSGGTFVYVTDTVSLEETDVEIAFRDMDWDKSVNTYIEYIIAYNASNRHFDNGYIEDYTYYMLGLGFGLDSDVTDSFNVGFDFKGRISPFGNVHSKGTGHDVVLSTNFAWALQGQMPFTIYMGKHAAFKIIPSAEYWKMSSSSGQGGLYIPTQTLVTWKLEAGIQLGF